MRIRRPTGLLNLLAHGGHRTAAGSIAVSAPECTQDRPIIAPVGAGDVEDRVVARVLGVLRDRG